MQLQRRPSQTQQQLGQALELKSQQQQPQQIQQHGHTSVTRSKIADVQPQLHAPRTNASPFAAAHTASDAAPSSSSTLPAIVTTPPTATDTQLQTPLTPFSPFAAAVTDTELHATLASAAPPSQTLEGATSSLEPQPYAPIPSADLSSDDAPSSSAVEALQSLPTATDTDTQSPAPLTYASPFASSLSPFE